MHALSTGPCDRITEDPVRAPRLSVEAPGNDSHEPAHPLASHPVTHARQRPSHLPGAVPRPLQVFLVREAHQPTDRLRFTIFFSSAVCFQYAGVQIMSGYVATMKQLDIFRDGRSVILSNALRTAVLSGDANDLEIAYRKLRDFDASHHWLPHAETLIDGLSNPPPSNVDESLSALARLEAEWAPAVLAILGEDGRGVLDRVWHAVGDALADCPFDPEQPDRHASYAYAKSADWKWVVRSVQGVRNYSAQPELLSRIAEAHWRQGRWDKAACAWFELCWSAPDRFGHLMNGGEIPDPLLQGGWNRARDQDIEIRPPWFPAWMLIDRPQIAGLIPAPDASADPQAAFVALRALTIDDGENMDRRKELQRLHPGLLACFLARR